MISMSYVVAVTWTTRLPSSVEAHACGSVNSPSRSMSSWSWVTMAEPTNCDMPITLPEISV